MHVRVSGTVSVRNAVSENVNVLCRRGKRCCRGKHIDMSGEHPEPGELGDTWIATKRYTYAAEARRSRAAAAHAQGLERIVRTVACGCRTCFYRGKDFSPEEERQAPVKVVACWSRQIAERVVAACE
jgi:hypothetical protein